MSIAPTHVFTIPPGVPFVDALAATLLAECRDDPQRLARYTVLLPTRRASRSLREAFLRRSVGKALLLPRMTPIGDMDEDELIFTSADPTLADANLDIPPAIPELRRRLLLAELARKVDGRSPEQAVRLAAELGRLIDQAETERLGFDRLATLVPARYAAHWQITLDFLRIVTEHWPKVLEEEGSIDPSARRNRLLDAQAALWRANPPVDPIVAAGSTGSIPATAELLAIIARLSNGRVVVPGLDRHTDSDAWNALEPSHPQFALKRLLERIGIERGDVEDWPCEGIEAAHPGRALLLAEALRPAATTDAWRRLEALPDNVTRGLNRVDCPTPREEAGAIALLMREALETPGRTAALVTPDRALARRVAVDLERWGIEVDDSAGTPLDATPPGAFLRLLAEAAAENLAPVPLVSLLKHPLAACGEEPGEFRRRVRALEMAVLRGARPAPGFNGLREALISVEVGKRSSLLKVVDGLEAALAPFYDLFQSRTLDVAQAIDAHVKAAEALATSGSQEGFARLWAGDAGEQAAGFIAELRAAALRFPAIDSVAYPGFFSALLSGLVVRAKYGRHPRLFIWGPLEARLQHADLLILGGLNEGTWPQEPAVDPWMSRPMRIDFGLPEPERRIGLSAHDFAQASAAGEVVLTRALKVDGTPTVPARWLLRLDNLLRAVGLRLERNFPSTLLGWYRNLDRPPHPATSILPPAPKPPLDARPRRLSVTDIETWMRDPYAIYARHILRLDPLDPLDADPGAADRGIFIHRILDRFVRKFPGALPPEAFGELLKIGEDVFRSLLDRPGVRTFWWPRFERIAAWFVESEHDRRPRIEQSLSEVTGALVFETADKPFTLTGRADRIDRLKAGGLAIVDYKTGTVPKIGDVKAGLAPQLSLEAAMAMEGAFRGVSAEDVTELAFWRLTGGHRPGEIIELKANPVDLAHDALAGLLHLIAKFDQIETGYEARPRPDYAPRFSDYEHLARVKEWSAQNGETE